MEIWIKGGGEYMNTLQKNIVLFISLITFVAGGFVYYAPVAFAASVSSHVRIVGTERTIWSGDVTTDGCTVTDNEGVEHTFTQPVALCALDAASQMGDFTYSTKDFGELGLLLQEIAEDAGASDFSTYWLYDVNGQAASVGAGSYVVNNGDSLYFHFENPNADVNKRAINDGIQYLRSQQDANGQISGFTGVSGWAAMTFAANGINPGTVANGGSSLLAYLTANPPVADASATDWERGILAITAAGGNPYNFGGIDYVSKLLTYHNNAQLGSTAQVNDDIFGLLALVSAGSGVPNGIKQDALNFILFHQESDGGFSWSTTGTSDVDDTAAALQALAAAKNAGMSAPNLANSITNAKSFLLAGKNSDGGFGYSNEDPSNASTTAWAVMALSALGDTGQDVTDAKAYLRGNQEENGSFKWQTGSVGETFTSSYAVLALTGKYWPVKVYEGPNTTLTPTPTPTPTSTPTPSPTATPTPTTPPSSGPTSTPTPTVAPSVSPTPRVTHAQKKRGHYREWMRQIREEQRRVANGWREQILTECEKFFTFFR